MSDIENLLLSVIAELEEWRAARQDIFTNTSKVSDEDVQRWKRLSNAENVLMARANTL